jgi:hypothetical protein
MLQICKKDIGMIAGTVLVAGVVGCMIKQRYDIENHEYGYKCEHGLPLNILVCTEKHPHLYQVMKRVDQALLAHKVDYVLVAGSALGAERHRGIIPWDDDIDMGVLDIDGAVEAIQQDWPEAIIEQKWYGGFQVEGCVDVFSMKRVGGKKVMYENYKARLMWPREFFLSEEFDPIRKRFGDIEVCVSSKNFDYVTRAYGKDCMVKCFVKTPHDAPIWKRIALHMNPLVKTHFQLEQKGSEGARIKIDT